jgi:hypothetical protein
MDCDICAPLHEANAVVVLFAGALGDFLLALPALRLLRRRHAAGRLVLAVRTPLRDLALVTGCADRVEALDDAMVAVFLGGGEAPAWWPGRPRLYSWFGGDDAAVQARLGACAVAAEFPRVVRGDGPVHAAAAYVDAIGEPWRSVDLPALATIEASADRVPPPAGRRLVLHRGAGAAPKRWHDRGFRDVAAWWCARSGEVVDLLGPAEEHLHPLPGVTVARDLPALEVAHLLAAASAYVGNDTGPSHLAAAVGLPSVVLFGPTDPERWRPLSSRCATLRAAPFARSADGFSDPPARVVVARLQATLP